MTLSSILTDSLKYWEVRRIPYNLILAAITLYHAIPAMIKDRGVDWPLTLMWLFVFAVIANLCYCFAYIPDVLIQMSDFREKWVKSRIGIFLIGVAFASCFSWWISHGIFSRYGTW